MMVVMTQLSQMMNQNGNQFHILHKWLMLPAMMLLQNDFITDDDDDDNRGTVREEESDIELEESGLDKEEVEECAYFLKYEEIAGVDKNSHKTTLRRWNKESEWWWREIIGVIIDTK